MINESRRSLPSGIGRDVVVRVKLDVSNGQRRMGPFRYQDDPSAQTSYMGVLWSARTASECRRLH